MLENRGNKIFQLIRELRSIIDFREVLEIAPSLYVIQNLQSESKTHWNQILKL